MRQLTALRKLDLSFNLIGKIDNLDSLKELRELNLAFNRLEGIDNLHKLPQLRVVVLNHNKIKRLESLKGCRKLEVISVIGNLLEDINVYGGGVEPLLELRELNAARNKIQLIKQAITLFPNVRISYSN